MEVNCIPAASPRKEACECEHRGERGPLADPCYHTAPAPRAPWVHRPCLAAGTDRPELPLGRGPAIRTEQPWRGALLFPSRGWRDACFPPLPFRTQTGMDLGQPGRGRTCQGPAGRKGAAMTASFRFGAVLSGVPSSLSPLSRPAGLRPSPADWVGEHGPSHPDGQPATPANCAPPTPTPGSPRHAPPAGGGPLRPRKRALEQFTAAASSCSSFLSGDKRRGGEPSAAQDAPPAGRAPISLRSAGARVRGARGPVTSAELRGRAPGRREALRRPRPSLRGQRCPAPGRSWCASTPHLPRTLWPRPAG